MFIRCIRSTLGVYGETPLMLHPRYLPPETCPPPKKNYHRGHLPLVTIKAVRAVRVRIRIKLIRVGVGGYRRRMRLGLGY